MLFYDVKVLLNCKKQIFVLHEKGILLLV